MGFLSKKMDALRGQWETDHSVRKAKTATSQALRRLPGGAAQYAIAKVPIVQWLPRYNPRWILNDFVAGMTIGVMMIPQALAYAKIATIPVEHGLYSSWLPAVIYVFMGTSKDLSTGPTSIMGLLTAEIILDLKEDKLDFAPQDVASAVALMVGVYSLILGLLKLGFVLDYISVPVLSGFLSAAALTILLGQIGSLVGLSNVPTGAANIISNVLSRVPEFSGLTCAVGFGGIFLLYLLELLGKTLGRRSAAVKFVSSSRAVIVLVVFTSISYAVNKDRRSSPLWEISKVSANGIKAPKIPSQSLVMKVAGKAIAPFVASALEHLAIGRAFGAKNGYAIDTSQELNYLGAANFVNSLFGAMSVGGAMSRTAVNSECGVRSPLNGLFTAGFIVLTLYKLAGVLFWIPKATLSAIIIMAVIHIIGPASLFYRYWRISFADFVASMLSFWITLFVSTETGIAVAVVFSVAYTMLRSAFSTGTVLSSSSSLPHSSSNLRSPAAAAAAAAPGGLFAQSTGRLDEYPIPSDTVLVQLDGAIFFPNANRVKNRVMESVQTLYDPVAVTAAAKEAAPAAAAKTEERSWSVAAEKRIAYLRRSRGVAVIRDRLSTVVWDLGRVPFVDATGVQALAELKAELRKHAGPYVQVRLVGLSKGVRARFDRAGWKLVGVGEAEAAGPDADWVYGSVDGALWDRGEAYETEKEGSVRVFGWT